eukprot:361838-Chlamydomonas_euryale.AAC.5
MKGGDLLVVGYVESLSKSLPDGTATIATQVWLGLGGGCRRGPLGVAGSWWLLPPGAAWSGWVLVVAAAGGRLEWLRRDGCCRWGPLGVAGP